jgi:hypothetical protein
MTGSIVMACPVYCAGILSGGVVRQGQELAAANKPLRGSQGFSSRLRSAG